MDEPIILFCDDCPLRAAKMFEWQTESERKRTVWVKTVKEALKVLREYGERVEQLHLDHDLDGQEPLSTNNPLSGSEIVRYFNNLPKDKRNKYIKLRITLHDHNRYAAMEQLRHLKALGFKVRWIPFGLENEIKL